MKTSLFRFECHFAAMKSLDAIVLRPNTLTGGVQEYFLFVLPWVIGMPKVGEIRAHPSRTSAAYLQLASSPLT